MRRTKPINVCPKNVHCLHWLHGKQQKHYVQLGTDNLFEFFNSIIFRKVVYIFYLQYIFSIGLWLIDWLIDWLIYLINLFDWLIYLIALIDSAEAHGEGGGGEVLEGQLQALLVQAGRTVHVILSSIHSNFKFCHAS